MFKFFNKNKESIIIKEDSVIKRYKKKKRFHSGLSAKQSFMLEFNCLNSLKDTFECICGYATEDSHFPKILDYNVKKLELVISYMGPTIYSYSIDPLILKIPDLKQQCRCIVQNLKNAGVKHLDIHKNNICLNNNVLGLIDFDIAHLEHEEIYSDLIKRRLNYFGNSQTESVNNLLKTILF